MFPNSKAKSKSTMYNLRKHVSVCPRATHADKLEAKNTLADLYSAHAAPSPTAPAALGCLTGMSAAAVPSPTVLQTQGSRHQSKLNVKTVEKGRGQDPRNVQEFVVSISTWSKGHSPG